MSKKTILYRGDSTTIDAFDFFMTKKECWYGRGIYLTDKRSVAETYRAKDIPKHLRGKLTDILYEGTGDDLNKAKELAVDALKKRIDPSGNLLVRNWHGKIGSKHQTMINRRVEELLPILKIEQNSVFTIGGKALGETLVYRKISLPTLPSVGRISIFQFSEPEFSRNIIDVERSIQDIAIAELLCDNVISGSPNTRRKLENIYGGGACVEWTLAKLVRHISIAQMHKQKIIDVNKLRGLLMPYGYLGLRYNGGVNTGNVNHNAYVVWDDAYVNRHCIT